jgi:mannose-6-phosphate isomerase-like protein (cupin superfamily)
MYILSDDKGHSRIAGIHGGSEAQAKLLFTRDFVNTEFDAVAHIRLDPGAEAGMHRHTRNEELFFMIAGGGEFVLDGERVEVGPGDVVMTGLGGAHAFKNRPDEPLTMIGMTALPAEITRALPPLTTMLDE